MRKYIFAFTGFLLGCCLDIYAAAIEQQEILRARQTAAIQLEVLPHEISLWDADHLLKVIPRSSLYQHPFFLTGPISGEISSSLTGLLSIKNLRLAERDLLIDSPQMCISIVGEIDCNRHGLYVCAPPIQGGLRLINGVTFGPASSHAPRKRPSLVERILHFLPSSLSVFLLRPPRQE